MDKNIAPPNLAMVNVCSSCGILWCALHGDLRSLNEMPEGERADKSTGKTTHFMTAELRRQPLRNQNKPLDVYLGIQDFLDLKVHIEVL